MHTSKSFNPCTFWYKTDVINATITINAIICSKRLTRRKIVNAPAPLVLITSLCKHFMWSTVNTLKINRWTLCHVWIRYSFNSLILHHFIQFIWFYLCVSFQIFVFQIIQLLIIVTSNKNTKHKKEHYSMLQTNSLYKKDFRSKQLIEFSIFTFKFVCLFTKSVAHRIRTIQKIQRRGTCMQDECDRKTKA